MIYKYGYNGIKDKIKSQIYFKQAVDGYQKQADQGNAFALLMLGEAYKYGDGIPKDLIKAQVFYDKAKDIYEKQAFKKDIKAQFRLGKIYQYHIPIDIKQSIEWYEMAANQGDPEAALRLGIIYKEGEYIPKDSVKAQQWFVKAKSGYEERIKAGKKGRVDALLELERMYKYGYGILTHLFSAKAYRQGY